MKSNTSPVEVLKRSKTIAVVGASRSEDKDAYTVPRYLKSQGYRIVPVNPKAGEIMGEKAYPSLLELPPDLGRAVDAVEVFRPSEELPKIAEQVVQMKRLYGRAPVFWSQAGLENDEARGILEAGGVDYVMNACMRTVHQLYVRRTVSASRRA